MCSNREKKNPQLSMFSILNFSLYIKKKCKACHFLKSFTNQLMINRIMGGKAERTMGKIRWTTDMVSLCVTSPIPAVEELSPASVRAVVMFTCGGYPDVQSVNQHSAYAYDREVLNTFCLAYYGSFSFN